MNRPYRLPEVSEEVQLFTNDGFQLAFQPVVQSSGPSLSVVAYEAFLRVGQPWCSDRLVTLIAAAEKDHSIIGVDTWVVGEVCKLLSVDSTLRIWANASQVSLASSAFVEAVLRSADEHQVAMRLTIEMTETADSDPRELRASIARLHGHAVAVLLDDIQDGFAKKSLLDSEAVVGCKLSHSTKVLMQKNRSARQSIAELVNWCHRAGKKVVMEGIETQAELAMAIDFGIELHQGYLFSRPMPLDRLKPIGSLIRLA